MQRLWNIEYGIYVSLMHVSLKCINNYIFCDEEKNSLIIIKQSSTYDTVRFLATLENLHCFQKNITGTLKLKAKS